MFKIAHPFPRTLRTEQGFSLVSVMIIMGIVLVAVLLITQSRVNQQSAQKTIRLKQSYQDVNQALINDLVSQIHDTITAGAPCINLSGINNAAPAYVYARTIPTGPGWPALHREAQKRCSRPRLPRNGNNPSDNKAYFCVRLGKDQGAPTDSILHADLAFAEVALELIDLQTQKPISCATYVARKSDPKDGAAGMAVTMGLYWQAKVGARLSYSQKALSYIANQN
ncbi:PulJ/GspJ family protein [Oligoflexus tunisiensis]|uniref:PulJ/GspJ family protein n=1 Tax=Oligoflexus tunisiensis TaxID=708132 RepID=UPI00114CD4D1|nr:hypothetical protein [Oligoflexus tunisiensis]